MSNKNKGYVGKSKSLRATFAEDDGEFPITVCQKKLKEATGVNFPSIFLKDNFDRSSWHHTSMMFKKTDYYKLEEMIESFESGELQVKFNQFKVNYTKRSDGCFVTLPIVKGGVEKIFYGLGRYDGESNTVLIPDLKKTIKLDTIGLVIKTCTQYFDSETDKIKDKYDSLVDYKLLAYDFDCDFKINKTDILALGNTELAKFILTDNFVINGLEVKSVLCNGFEPLKSISLWEIERILERCSEMNAMDATVGSNVTKPKKSISP